VSRYPAFVRADVNYVGEYETNFKSLGYDTAGDYVNVNMRLGLTLDQWSLAFYVVNLTDESSLIHVTPNSEYVIRPRKVGLEASYAF
jgi:outer membrane receptor protein involved in Fe transport